MTGNTGHKDSKEESREDVVEVKREKFEIAIKDIGLVASFLDGIEVMIEDDKGRYNVGDNSSKLTNAIQWLNNWGD